MKKHQELILEAIRNAERAVALLKDLRPNNDKADSVTEFSGVRVRSLVIAAHAELAYSLDAVNEVLKILTG